MRGHSCWTLHLCFMVYVAMGIVYYVLIGCWMDVGEVLRDADGVLCLLCVCWRLEDAKHMRELFESKNGVGWLGWSG